MAKAKKCDICGACYDCYENDYNTIVMQILEDYDCLNLEHELDVCPNCMRSIKDHIKTLGLDLDKPETYTK